MIPAMNGSNQKTGSFTNISVAMLERLAVTAPANPALEHTQRPGGKREEGRGRRDEGEGGGGGVGGIGVVGVGVA
jgi:hypothetical protein